MAEFKNGLCWLRRDLRWTDHVALKQACEKCESVAVVFVFDSNILEKLEDPADRRLTVIQRALEEVDQALRKKGSRLVVAHGDPVQEIPKLVKKLNVNAVFTNEDYESYAKNRDETVREKLESQGLGFFSFKDQVIFSGSEVLKGDGTPYQVFTPYMRLWKKTFKKNMADEQKPNLKKLTQESGLSGTGKLESLGSYGFQESEVLVPLGRSGALKLLKMFDGRLKSYDKDRDFPALRGTSSFRYI